MDKAAIGGEGGMTTEEKLAIYHSAAREARGEIPAGTTERLGRGGMKQLFQEGGEDGNERA